jgi:hypothetical protein
MTRPVEYLNLIQKNYLEEVAQTPGAIAQYLKNAQDYLSSALHIPADLTMQRFTLAYEGYFQLVQAIQEFHGVRAKDAGRTMVIQRISSDLKLPPAELALMIKAHERRNRTTYLSPFPPVSKAEAAALIAILQKYIPAAHKLTGTPLLP